MEAHVLDQIHVHVLLDGRVQHAQPVNYYYYYYWYIIFYWVLILWLILIIAVCSSGCYNGGRCIRPNTCLCASGWTGPTCSTGILRMQCQYLSLRRDLDQRLIHYNKYVIFYNNMVCNCYRGHKLDKTCFVQHVQTYWMLFVVYTT